MVRNPAAGPIPAITGIRFISVLAATAISRPATRTNIITAPIARWRRKLRWGNSKIRLRQNSRDPKKLVTPQSRPRMPTIPSSPA